MPLPCLISSLYITSFHLFFFQSTKIFTLYLFNNLNTISLFSRLKRIYRSKMSSWSSENATNAYITTLKMERKQTEPDSAEFISALAAGNNAQTMLIACAGKPAINNILALIAAANQTGGYVHCILPTQNQLNTGKRILKSDSKFVNFIIGNADEVLSLDKYKDSDFMLIDCNIQNYDKIMRQIKVKKGKIVVGFNAFCKGSSWQWSGLRTQLLPIGDGLLVTRIDGNFGKEVKKKSNWVVKVDEFTGEEHVFRVRSSSQRKLEASA